MEITLCFLREGKGREGKGRDGKGWEGMGRDGMGKSFSKIEARYALIALLFGSHGLIYVIYRQEEKHF